MMKKKRGRLGNGLTPKQSHFARLVAAGKPQSEAYREAYDTKGKPQTVACRAWELMQREDIKREIDRLVERKNAQIIRSSLSDRERVLAKLREWIDSADSTDSNKIRAAELLGKSVGLFKDVHVDETQGHQSAEELQAELFRRLEELTGQKGNQTEH